MFWRHSAGSAGVPLRPAAGGGRYFFIDLYRSAVILLMLEGHTFRTLLPSSFQEQTLFQYHEFFHGLSAPAFLFGAGLTFVISTKKRWEEYHHWGAPLGRRVRRLILVLLLGLSLHLPFFSFRKIIVDSTHADALQLFEADVLHCIGIGLLLLHGLVFLFKKEDRFYGLVLAGILTVCFVTPMMWGTDFGGILPPPLSQLMNGLHGSPFPLFPYIGFLFAGVLVSWEFLLAAEEGKVELFMLKLAVAGAAIVAVGIVGDMIPFRIYPPGNYWLTSPNYFFVRTGSLLLLCAAAWYVARFLPQSSRLLTVLGKESLFVYVLHLVVLYGSAANPAMNLQAIFGQSLTGWESVGMFVLITVSMTAVALLWNWLKEKHPLAHRIVRLAGAGVFLILFCTRDF